jgi:predicted small secreted protein
MKRPYLLITFLLLCSMFINGCATWHGIKKDTKEIIHVVES